MWWSEKDPEWKFPSVEQVQKLPAFPTCKWLLEPHQSGVLEIKGRRGSPFGISWEVHGDGPVKLLFINGLGVTKMSYQRQTKYFGHEHGDRYSVLVMDNRGAGKSSLPLVRYTTTEFARDVLAVLDHVGWTSPREVHVTGISMGGMIAQELAMLIPERMASLSLLSTAAIIENTSSFGDGMAKRAAIFMPRTLDNSVKQTGLAIFPRRHFEEPDNADVPTKDTPRVKFPEGHTEYKMFANNYERFAAQEMVRRTQENSSIVGLVLQGIAAGWHRKTPEQLKFIADNVGRERILVMHGTLDRLFPFIHGQRLIDQLEPAVGLIVQDMGHAPPVERTRWFNDVAQKHFESSEKLLGR